MITNVVVCGPGRLGLPLALNFERASGLTVAGYDCNVDYVARLNTREFLSDEPGVTEMLRDSEIRFGTDISIVLNAEVAVVCVRTDSDSSGAYDLSQLTTFVAELAAAVANEKNCRLRALVINCNVNPGTSQRIAAMLSEFNVEVYFWPEWVKQGSIVEDQLHPPVTVIGTQTAYGFLDDVLAVLTSLDKERRAPIRLMSLTEAELCKISLNCFLTVKISFANMVATLLEELGLNAERVLEALGHDPRIGGAFLKPGFGYGGPCLPRDNGAMTAFASQYGIGMALCEAADRINEQRHQHLSRQAARRFHAEGVVPALETLSYKPGIPIFSESQQLRLAAQMSSLGIKTRIADGGSAQRVATLPEGRGLLLVEEAEFGIDRDKEGNE